MSDLQVSNIEHTEPRNTLLKSNNNHVQCINWHLFCDTYIAGKRFFSFACTINTAFLAIQLP